MDAARWPMKRMESFTIASRAEMQYALVQAAASCPASLYVTCDQLEGPRGDLLARCSHTNDH